LINGLVELAPSDAFEEPIKTRALLTPIGSADRSVELTRR
jgi:hypothetical protein